MLHCLFVTNHHPLVSELPLTTTRLLLNSKRVAPQGVMCACAVAEGETKTKQGGGDNSWRRFAGQQAAVYSRQCRGHELQHHGGHHNNKQPAFYQRPLLTPFY